jgi:predicted DCC family thiol-disulfide oxidoreductase YuxK
MNRILLLYDGHCLLCNRFIRRLLRKDSKDILKVAALQDYELLENEAPVAIRSDVDSVILIAEGRAYYKSTAALKTMVALSKMSWPFFILLYVPRIIRDGIYDIVASNRYRWFGRSESCILPEPSLKKKYLLKREELSNYLSDNQATKIR